MVSYTGLCQSQIVVAKAQSLEHVASWVEQCLLWVHIVCSTWHGSARLREAAHWPSESVTLSCVWRKTTQSTRMLLNIITTRVWQFVLFLLWHWGKISIVFSSMWSGVLLLLNPRIWTDTSVVTVNIVQIWNLVSSSALIRFENETLC